MEIINIIVDAYRSSDGIGRLIVDILIVGSMIIWAISITKYAQCRSVVKACKNLMQQMGMLGTMQHKILGELERDAQIHGPLAEMGRTATKALLEILRPSPQDRYAILNTGTFPRALTIQEIERIEVAMDNEINKQQNALEERLTIMGSIITLAPMLGLLGTVWGVMATFIGIVNNGGRPDIQAIAPGISGALLTTVGGLIVSIPSIAVNNFVVSLIQKTDQHMEDFKSMIITSLQLAKTNPKSQETPPAPAAQQPVYQQNAPVAQQPATAPAIQANAAAYQSASPAAQPNTYPQTTTTITPQPQAASYRPAATYPPQSAYQQPAAMPQQPGYPQQMPRQQAGYPQQAQPSYQSPNQETRISVTQNPNQNF